MSVPGDDVDVIEAEKLLLAEPVAAHEWKRLWRALSGGQKNDLNSKNKQEMTIFSRLEPPQFHREYMQGLERARHLIQNITNDFDVAQRVLAILVQRVVPDYFTPEMSGLHAEWKVIYGLVHHFDSRIALHLSTHFVSLQLLCTKWFYSLFSNALPQSIVGQVYTWILAENRLSKNRSKWFQALSVGILLYMSDTLLGVTDYTSMNTLLDHFCQVTLADDVIAKSFLELICAIHENIKAPFPPIRIVSPPDDCNGRVFLPCLPTSYTLPNPQKWLDKSILPPQPDGFTYQMYLRRRPRAFSDIEGSIDKDIPRTFLTNSHDALRRILIAFAARCPTIGYCQGMNEIGAALLEEAQGNEDVAFWALVYLIEEVFPKYHEHSMAGLHADCALLDTWLKQNEPFLSHHLDTLGLNIEVLCTTWLVTCYISNSPAIFYRALLQHIFQAPSAGDASKIPILTAFAAFRHLAPLLQVEKEAGHVLRHFKTFFASLDSKEKCTAFLAKCTCLWAQLPSEELRASRMVHLESVHAMFDARHAKKEALRSQKLSPEAAKEKRQRRSRFGLVTLPSPPKSPIRKLSLLGTNVRKSWKRSGVPDEEEVVPDTLALHFHLLRTVQLYDDEMIDSNEFSAIQRQILTTWLDNQQTPEAVAARVHELKSAMEALDIDSSPPKSTTSLWHKAKAKAGLNAWKLRSSKPNERRASAPRPMNLSPRGLELSEISKSYYGSEFSEDQRVSRKLELISQSIFD